MNPPKNKSIGPKKPVARKRGGQPGNSNASKHGFYTKNFSPAECRGLQSTQGVVLGDEIALLRVQETRNMAIVESAQNLVIISEALL